MHKSLFAIPLLLSLAICSQTACAAQSDQNAKHIEHGRYLVKIAGCNDCHTTGYAQSGGQIPEKEWLKGDQLGWRGPWGTTYAINLRVHVQNISEEQWVNAARTTKSRPPMPWFALRDMKDSDLRDIYRFIKQLGAAGAAAPSFVPPDQTATGPYVQFPAPPK